MDVESKDIERWIRGQVAKKNPKVGKAICPYAAQTLKNKKIQIIEAKDNLLAQVNQLCDLFSVFNLDIIVIYINSKIKESTLANICRKAHNRTPSMAVMYDHPINSGKHKGVSFSFGKAPLVFIQSLPKIKVAQKQLEKTGYYKAWGIKDYNQFY